MNRQEFDNKIAELKEQYKKEEFKIVKEYCDSNNPFKIGDTISDLNRGINIIIEKIGYYKGLSDEFVCRYYGVELLKSGKPNAKGNKSWIYQSEKVVKIK